MADPLRGAARLMGMSDAVWRRHANPWSVWTRFTVLPLLILAIWSRVWLGWGAVVPVALALGWTWLNPRLFPPPRSCESWASRGVLGEYVLLHHRAAVAAHHRRAAVWLAWAALPGIGVLAVGLWRLWWDWTLFGAALAVLPKVWFVDRMVWVYDDFRRAGGRIEWLEEEAG